MSAKIEVEKNLGVLLIMGTLISTIFVFIGGILFLVQNGLEIMSFEELRQPPTITSIKSIWQAALSFTPLGIVQLGLLLLVSTQLLRVAVLFTYYLAIKDYWFTLICGFVLFVLIYSFL